MLVLTREITEKIFIGSDIVVSVQGVHGGKVRLGIEAPPGIEIVREEIYCKTKAEKLIKSIEADSSSEPAEAKTNP